jgi:hypothetical protein
VFCRDRLVSRRDRPVFDLDSGVCVKDGEEGPGIVEEGTARELCDVSVFARVRETLLALREGGPTKSAGAGRRWDDCLDIWFLFCENASGGCRGSGAISGCIEYDPGSLHVKVTSTVFTISLDERGRYNKIDLLGL